MGLGLTRSSKDACAGEALGPVTGRYVHTASMFPDTHTHLLLPSVPADHPWK